MPFKEFMTAYAVLAVLGIAFLIWRRPRRGTLLRMGGRRQQAISAVSLADSSERSLNVIFNYNGHSWDAFEVLGLPAGSPLERVESAFREATSRVDSGSKPFLEAAYKAIRHQLG